MITKTITGASQWSEPILVGDDQSPLITVRQSTAPFAATISVQRIEDITLPTPPASTDTNWLTVKQQAVDSAGAVMSGLPGAGWYRAGVAAGGYTSGQAVLTITAERK